MKVGILTFHCAHNYGAVLQAYALQETIKKLGTDVEIINYQPTYLIEQYKPFSRKLIFSGTFINQVKKLAHAAIIYSSKLKRWKVFNNFITNKLNLSGRICESIPGNYDLYIIGSDQVWNYKITKGFDQVFWGFFNTKIAARKITYAASFGDVSIQEEKIFLTKAFKNFASISLRENDYIEYIQQIGKSVVHKVFDPTLILDVDKWNKVAIDPMIKNKYILIYQVIRSKETLKIASQIAKQIQGVLIEVPSHISYKKINDKYNAVSPFEFLGLIKNASCIVTTSFHGTAFSIIYRKDFYTVNLENGSEKRSSDLLTTLQLSHRLISKHSSVDFTKIDYTKSTSIIEELKQDSLQFLKNNLAGYCIT